MNGWVLNTENVAKLSQLLCGLCGWTASTPQLLLVFDWLSYVTISLGPDSLAPADWPSSCLGT